MIKYQHCKTFQAGHFCCKGLTLSATQITSTGAMSWCSPDQTFTDGRHRCTAAQSGTAAAPSVASCCTPGIFFINDLVRNNKGVSIRQHTRESGSQQQQPAAVAALATDVERGLKRIMNSLSRVQNNGASLHYNLPAQHSCWGPSPAGRLEQASKHV